MSTYLPQFKDILDGVATTLDNIYARLHDVKVSSYVNARIVDTTGEVPIPASEAGLLVEVVAIEYPSPVNIVQSIPMVISGTVPVSVTSMQPITGSVTVDGTVNANTRVWTSDGWKAVAGLDVNKLDYFTAGIAYQTDVSGCAMPLSGTGGFYTPGEAAIDNVKLGSNGFSNLVTQV